MKRELFLLFLIAVHTSLWLSTADPRSAGEHPKNAQANAVVENCLPRDGSSAPTNSTGMPISSSVVSCKTPQVFLQWSRKGEEKKISSFEDIVGGTRQGCRKRSTRNRWGGAAAVVGKMEPVGTVARQVGTYMKTLDLSQPHYSRVFTDDTGTQTAAEMQQQYISGPSQPFPFVAQCAVLQGKTAPEMFELIG